ncbi:MAG: hypothetical protein AABX59_03150, partial [Nanoarchaeota archaeon]
GFIIAEKDGYARTKQQISTNVDSLETQLVLNKLNKLDVNLRIIDLNGNERSLGSNEFALVSIVEEDREFQQSLVYPEDSEIELTGGLYEVKIQLFKDQVTTFEPQKIENCIKVPASGILGIFGAKEEQCNTVEIPAQEVTQMLFGGTSFNWFVQKSDIENANRVTLYAIEYDVPGLVDDLSKIYLELEVNSQYDVFKQPEFS